MSADNNFIYLKCIQNYLKVYSFRHFSFIIKILIKIKIITT